MANVCYVCDIDKGVEACIGCEKPVCKTHAGYMKNYLSMGGKKGRACNACIEEAIVIPDYGLLSPHTIATDAMQRLKKQFYPQVYADIEKLTEKIKTESFAEAHVLVKELEQSVARTAENVTLQLEKTADKMVAENLAKVEQTLIKLTEELAEAIRSQRIEVSSDAEKIISDTDKIITKLSKAIQMSLIYMAVIIVIGFAGIKLVLG